MSLAKKFEENFDSDDEAENVFDRKESDKSTAQRCFAACANIIPVSLVYLSLNLNDIRARKKSFCLGVASCCLVVAFTALMFTTLQNLPVLFLRLGEIENGEMDLILTPGGEAADAVSLNYSIVKQMFSPSRDSVHSFHTSRVGLSRMVFSWAVRDCIPPQLRDSISVDSLTAQMFWHPNVTTNETCGERSCVFEYCPFVFNEVTLLFIDFANEKRMELGRMWPYPVPGASECIISSGLAARLNVTIGERIVVEASELGRHLLQAYIDSSLLYRNVNPLRSRTSRDYTAFGTSVLVLDVIAIAEKSYGKFGNSIDNYILMQSDVALPEIAAGLSPSLPSYQREKFAAVDPSVVATEIIFNYPPEKRLSWYSLTDYADIAAFATDFTSVPVGRLGFNQLDIVVPIVRYMYTTRFFSLFIGLILSLIIVGLSCLSIILIYSLLTVGIETRTFELGIIRMLGMSRVGLTCYVLCHALLFAFPAWLLGLAIGQIGFVLIRTALSSALSIVIPWPLTPSGVLWATVAGLAIPLLSSIPPIMQVISQQLPQALNTQRTRIEPIRYGIERSIDETINWTAVGMGLALAIFGFLLFYLFPLALLTFNITLMFYIFFGILLGMIFGLVLLAVNFERLMESFIAHLFFYIWEARAVFILIGKNLTAHRIRNRKTTLMYAMALAFIIFVTVAFQMQLTSIEFFIRQEMGGELVVEGPVGWSKFVELDHLLQTEMKDKVHSVAWVTIEMIDFADIENTTIETLGRYVKFPSMVVAVNPSFFEVADNSFLRIAEQDEAATYSLAEQLYTRQGSSSLILGSLFKSKMALDSLNSRFLFETELKNPNGTFEIHRVVLTPSAFVDAAPVLRFSKFPSLTRQNSVLSLPSLISKSRGALRSLQDVQFEFIIVRAPEDAVPAIGAAVQEVLGNGPYEVRNFNVELEGLRVAKQVINFFFLFTEIVAMSICFFALTSSMATNIYEQTKEIGILRCVGIQIFPCWRTYVWEAFVLVVSSSLLGALIGIAVAYTMLLQNSLFTQLPLPFVVPWLQLFGLVAFGIVCAFLSTYGPIRTLLASPSVTHILHRVT